MTQKSTQPKAASRHGVSLLFTAIGALVSSCTGAVQPKGSTPTDLRTSKQERAFHFTEPETASAPHVVGDEQMQTRDEVRKNLPQGILNQDSSLMTEDGEQILCELNIGTEVSVMGAKGEHVLVALNIPCGSDSKKIYEGYVPAGAVQVAQSKTGPEHMLTTPSPSRELIPAFPVPGMAVVPPLNGEKEELHPESSDL